VRRTDLLIAAALTGLIALIHGMPVPWGNEHFYLWRLYREWHPAFLGHDWTLTHSGAEHFWFNRVFGALTLWLPLGAVAWIGRLATWSLTLLGLIGLGRRMGVPPLASAVAIALWLGLRQSLVAAEQLLVGFEAKTAAYSALVWALVAALDGRLVRCGMLTGLTVCLHPAVGVWGGLAQMAGLLARPTPLPRLAIFVLWSGAIGALGILPVLPALFGGEAPTAGDLEFLVRGAMGMHLDVTSWPQSRLFSLAWLAAAMALHLASPPPPVPQRRQLAGFLAAAAAVFMAGLVCHALGWYRFLGYYPFRLFPVIAPLLFLLMVAARVTRREPPRRPVLVWTVTVMALLSLGDPFYGLADDATQRWRGSTLREEREARPALAWIATHTPEDAVLAAPPWWKFTWSHGRRAIVASAQVPVYEQLGRWRERVEALNGGDGRDGIHRTADAGFYALTEADLQQLRERYGASFLVTRTPYALPERFRSGPYRVYELKPPPAP
jgi:hypothetical protein